MYFLIAWKDQEGNLTLVHFTQYPTEYSYLQWLQEHKEEYTGFKIIKGNEITVLLM
jgi:hypothetical protein